MCLGIPVKVLQIKNETTARVDAEGVQLDVSTMLVENLEVGKYVLVHAGFIIEKISDIDAEEKIKLLDEFREKTKEKTNG